MTWYQLFKGIHVMAAVVWVGGALFSSVLGARIARTNDGPRMAGFSGDIEHIGMRLFLPASFLLVLTGTAMMLNGDLDWGQLWVDYGLAIWLLGFVLGIGYFGPQTGQLKTLIEEEGPDSPVVKERIRQILTVSHLELVLLLGVVWAMAVKPSTDHPWWLAAYTVVLVAALVAVARPLFSKPS